jgi:hypothetical protein
MGVRGILVLLVVALGLGAVLWFTDEKPKVDQVAETAVLEGRSLGDCVRMRWQCKGRAPIEIGRGASGMFEMKEPLVDMASVAHMRQIVTAWDNTHMRAAPLADDANGRQQAGLDPPELTFTADFPDGQTLAIDVGGPGPLGDTRFLRSHGKIWEGGGGLLESMQGNPDDLREHIVFRNAYGQVDELRVEQLRAGGKRETIHVKREAGGWRLLAPVQGRADPVATQSFVTAVMSLRADSFPAGMIKPRTDAPSLELLVVGSFGEEKLSLWDERREMFGRLPGRNLWFTSDSLQYGQIFDNAVDHMRARILVPMGESSFSELLDLLVDPGQGRGDRVRLTRETSNAPWRLAEPVTFAGAVTPCQEAVEAVQLLVATEFVDDPDSKHPRADDPRYGLQAAAGRLQVSLRGVRDQKATTLWFGKDVQRGDEWRVYTCRADEPDTVVLVQRDYVARLRRSWLDYCSLVVVQQGAGVDRIDLAHRDGNKRTFQVENDKWVLVGTAGERREVGELVDNDLRDLRGTKAVDARGEAFAQPDWTLDLMRKGGDKLGTLRFWDRGADQPLLVQRDTGERSPVAFELRVALSKEVRALWK